MLISAGLMPETLHRQFSFIFPPALKTLNSRWQHFFHAFLQFGRKLGTDMHVHIAKWL